MFKTLSSSSFEIDNNMHSYRNLELIHLYNFAPIHQDDPPLSTFWWLHFQQHTRSAWENNSILSDK